MKLFVGVTNNDWFRFLSERQPDEVNFWRPRSQTDFKALQPGDLFLFKLHSPLDFIAGATRSCRCRSPGRRSARKTACRTLILSSAES
jgi:hypothetical protein